MCAIAIRVLVEFANRHVEAVQRSSRAAYPTRNEQCNNKNATPSMVCQAHAQHTVRYIDMLGFLLCLEDTVTPIATTTARGHDHKDARKWDHESFRHKARHSSLSRSTFERSLVREVVHNGISIRIRKSTRPETRTVSRTCASRPLLSWNQR